MKQNTPKLNEMNRRHGMKVPENYFANFAEQMVEQLPEREFPLPETPTLWLRVRPWIYMAAMFAGIWLMMKMFTGISSVERGETEVDMVAATVDELTVEEELINFYVDDYTAYEMLYADSEY